MATEGNEYRLRQQQRAEARRKRERAQKLMMIRLGIAVAVIIAAALVMWMVTRDGKPPGTPSQPQPNAPVISTQAPEITEPVV